VLKVEREAVVGEEADDEMRERDERCYEVAVQEVGT
jgi:hypothetical protein